MLDFYVIKRIVKRKYFYGIPIGHNIYYGMCKFSDRKKVSNMSTNKQILFYTKNNDSFGKNKQYIILKVKKLNNFIKADHFRLFKDGNNRYFICEKVLYPDSYTTVHKDEKGVFYEKVQYFADRRTTSTDVHNVEKGFKDIDEACKMLEYVREWKKENMRIQTQEAIEAEKRKICVPIDCL